MTQSYIYTHDGEIVEYSETYKGMPFFRKMTRSPVELEICRILKDNPHPNIVQIYRVGTTFVDMELVHPCHQLRRYDIREVWSSMNKALIHMQTLGILYVDWKVDNIGKNMKTGEFKLYDFDVSGIYDYSLKNWKMSPPKYYAYKEATKFYVDPIMIDKYSFYKGIIYKSEDVCQDYLDTIT